jgi:hypothetical protein
MVAMPSIGALALRRLLKRRAIASAQLFAMALAIGVPLSLQSVTTVAGNAGYLSAISANSRDSLVTIITSGAETADSYKLVQRDIESAVLTTVGNRLDKILEFGRIASFDFLTVNGKQVGFDPPVPNLLASYYPSLEKHAGLLQGTWPAGASPGQPVPVAFSEGGSALYGLKVGDVACLHAVDVDPAPPQVCVVVAGIWKPQQVSDAFWLGGPGSTEMTLSADGYWNLQELVKGIRSAGVSVYRPNAARLTVAEAPALQNSIVRLRGSRQFAGNGLRPSADVVTSLDRRIGDFLKREAVNQFPIQIVAVAMICVVLYGLVFVSQSFLRAQEQQAVLWRVRGWSRARLGVFMGVHLIALVIPALVLAIGIAVASTWAVATGQGAPYTPTAPDLLANFGQTLVWSLLGVLVVCFGLVAIFSWRSVGQMRRSLGRPAPVAWWRYRNADLFFALLAIPLLIEASLRGQETVRSAVAGSDPIGLLLPILGLGGIAVAELRLLPLAAPALLIMRGVPARLTSWRLAGQPAEHAGVAILLALTIGVGAFASVYASTQTANAMDRAAYATGADMRVTLEPVGSPAVPRAVLGTVHDVSAVTSILRKTIRFPSSGDTLVAFGIDGATYAQAAWSRRGLTNPELSQTMQNLSGKAPSITLLGEPTALRLWVRGIDQPVLLGASVRDAKGQVAQITLSTLAFNGWHQVQGPINFPSPPLYPLQLLSLDAKSSGSGGAIALSRLEAISAGGATTVETFEHVSGWWARDSTGLMFAPGIKQRHGDINGLELPLPANGSLAFYPPFGSDPLPVLMSSQTVARFGLQPGESIPLLVNGNQVVAKIVQTVDFVPTLYPSDDFAVIPLDRALSKFAAAGDEPAIPNELWVALTPAAAAQPATLPSTTGVNFVVYRTFEVEAALNDPILIQLRGNLAIGFASALGLAVLGFAVHFLIATRRRLSEHAILLANGLEPEDIHRGIALEQAAVVVFGLVAGLLLAIVAAVVLLPSLQLGNKPEDTVPPTVIHLDGSQLAAGALALLLSITLLAWVTRRAGSGVNVVNELRRLG